MADTRDWTKTGTVEGMAEWIRGKSDALCVVVVRTNDAVLIADPDLAPTDARDLTIERVIDLARSLEEKRKGAHKSARLELEPVRE